MDNYRNNKNVPLPVTIGATVAGQISQGPTGNSDGRMLKRKNIQGNELQWQWCVFAQNWSLRSKPTEECMDHIVYHCIFALSSMSRASLSCRSKPGDDPTSRSGNSTGNILTWVIDGSSASLREVGSRSRLTHTLLFQKTSLAAPPDTEKYTWNPATGQQGRRSSFDQ